MLKRPKTFIFNTISVEESCAAIVTVEIMTYPNTAKILGKIFGLMALFPKQWKVPLE
jgi:hypothetical protein